jgi:nuclear GTP-binding protein
VLRKQCETFFFRSASAFLPNESTSLDKGKAKEKADDAVGAHSILAFLGKLAEEKGSTLSVAVVGITNVRFH